MRTHYPGLDIIRFSAAMLVTVFHLGFLWWAHAGDDIATKFRDDLAILAPFISSGWVGVPIFFMLSGFVIAFSAEGRSAGQFVNGRAARLYPAAWICSAVTAVAIAPDPLLWRKLAASLSLWPVGPWISGVYWTLAVELMFYLLVAVLLAFRRSGALDKLGVWLAVAGSGYWLLRLTDFATGGHFKSIFGFMETPYGGLFLVNNAAHFAFGMLLWTSVRDGLTRSSVGLMVACVASGLISTTASARFNVTLNSLPASWMPVAPTVYLTGAIAIVAAVAGNSWLLRWTGRRSGAVRTLGLLTYPLYLVHSEVGERLMRSVAALGGWGSLAVALVGVLALAALTIRLERYPRHLITSLLNPAVRNRAAARP